MGSLESKHHTDNLGLGPAQLQTEEKHFNQMTNSKLCCISYNSRGCSEIKTTFMKYLVSRQVVGDKLPILCNQENFILRDNSYKIANIFPDFQVLINPAVKTSQDKGRPKNGMFIAIPEKRSP